jgi:hypothetical protein
VVSLAGTGLVLFEDVVFAGVNGVEYVNPIIVAEEGFVSMKGVEIKCMKLSGTSASLLRVSNNLSLSIYDIAVNDINCTSQHALFLECVVVAKDRTEISILNASFENVKTNSVCGGLIYVAGSTSVTVVISNTTAKNIDVDVTVEGVFFCLLFCFVQICFFCLLLSFLGGVFYIDFAGVFAVRFCSFEDVGISQRGGLGVIGKVSNSNVSLSNFTHCTANGDGGALLYLNGSKMQLYQFVFFFCCLYFSILIVGCL